ARLSHSLRDSRIQDIREGPSSGSRLSVKQNRESILPCADGLETEREWISKSPRGPQESDPTHLDHRHSTADAKLPVHSGSAFVSEERLPFGGASVACRS